MKNKIENYLRKKLEERWPYDKRKEWDWRTYISAVAEIIGDMSIVDLVELLTP